MCNECSDYPCTLYMSSTSPSHWQASYEVPYLKKIKEYLLTLWKFFHFSPVQAAGLKLIQEAMSLPELKMLKGVDTRWLSHKASVSALLRSLPAVLVTLQQQSESEPTAMGLYKLATRYSCFFASLLLLNDVFIDYLWNFRGIILILHLLTLSYTLQ